MTHPVGGQRCALERTEGFDARLTHDSINTHVPPAPLFAILELQRHNKQATHQRSMDGSQPSHPQRSDAECDEGSDWSLHNNSRSTTSWNGNLVYDGSLPFPRQQQQPQQTIHGGPAIAIVPMPPQAGQFQEPNWPPPCTANMSTQQDFYIHHPGAVVGLNTWAPLSPEDLDGMLAPEDLDGMLAPANFMPSVPVTPNRKLPREGWTQEQQNMLIKARQAGLGFTEISAKMRVKHGVEISPNALVKRFQKVQGHYLGVSGPPWDKAGERNKRMMTDIQASRALLSRSPRRSKTSCLRSWRASGPRSSGSTRTRSPRQRSRRRKKSCGTSLKASPKRSRTRFIASINPCSHRLRARGIEHVEC